LIRRRKFLSDDGVADLLERADDSDDNVGVLSASEESADDDDDGVLQEETVEVVEDVDDRVVLTPPPGTPDPALSPGSQDLFVDSPVESLPSPSVGPPAKRPRVEPVRQAQLVMSDDSGMIPMIR
jgi:hypothetical protein